MPCGALGLGAGRWAWGRSADRATLRESQTMTLLLPNTGEAVVLDAGEGRDVL